MEGRRKLQTTSEPIGMLRIKSENKFLKIIQKHTRFLKKGTVFHPKKAYLKIFLKKEKTCKPRKMQGFIRKFYDFQNKIITFLLFGTEFECIIVYRSYTDTPLILNGKKHIV